MNTTPAPPSDARQPADEERWLHAALDQADPALLAKGWQRRFVTEGRRADEFADLYRQLGHEVRLEPLDSARLPEGCSDCRLVMLLQFRAVYTRKPPPDSRGDGRKEANAHPEDL